MKDEIKEILDLLNFNRDTISNGTCRVEDFISREQIIKLLDYITNLQEENEINIDKYNDLFLYFEDYKSRIEKAIEYNYELQERYCHSALFDEPVASKIYEISEKQLNILQGVGKE